MSASDGVLHASDMLLPFSGGAGVRKRKIREFAHQLGTRFSQYTRWRLGGLRYAIFQKNTDQFLLRIPRFRLSSMALKRDWLTTPFELRQS